MEAVDAPSTMLVWRQEVVIVDDAPLLLSDIADLSRTPPQWRSALETVELASKAAVQRAARSPERTLTVRWRDAAARARATIPAIAPYVPSPVGGETRITLRSSSTIPFTKVTSAVANTCVLLVHPIDEGVAPMQSDLETIRCPEGAITSPLRYDASQGVIIATRTLATGTVIAAPPSELLASVRAGDPLYFSMRIGPVSVTREARAVRSSPANRGVAARTEDGPLLTATAQEIQP